MPSVFKKNLEGAYGGALFVTALSDDHLQIYPLSVWEEIEARVNALGKMNPLKRKFMTRANRCGAEVEMDGQGRISLRSNQRKLVGIDQEVSLIGCTAWKCSSSLLGPLALRWSKSPATPSSAYLSDVRPTVEGATCTNSATSR